MRNTTLYFGLIPLVQAFTNLDTSTAPDLALTTGGFGGTLPTGVDFIKAGGLKVTVVAHANHTFGSAYGTPAAGDVVDISKGCTIHASDGKISVVTVASDAVNGHTSDVVQANAANNDYVVTGLKPFAPAHGIAYQSNKLVGTAVSGGATTALNFVDNAGAADATDTITVTHASGKQKEFIEDLMDVVADDNKVSGMVVVRDDMRDLSLPTTRGTVIASVA